MLKYSDKKLKIAIINKHKIQRKQLHNNKHIKVLNKLQVH